MIILDSSTKLQVILAGAVASNQSDVTAHYADHTTTSYSPAIVTAATNGGTAVDLVTAPAASTTRHIKVITIQNNDTAPILVTFRTNNSGTTRTVFKSTLAIGDQASYEDADGWKIIDALGSRKTVTAAMVGRGVYSSRPSAPSVPSGYIYTATDIGSGMTFVTDGATWRQEHACHIWSSIADKTIANTTTKTTLLGTASVNSNLTLPASSWTVGRSLHGRLIGNWNSVSTHTIAIEIKIGSVVVFQLTSVDPGIAPLVGVAPGQFELEFDMLCRDISTPSAAVFHGFGVLSYNYYGAYSLSRLSLRNTATFTLDITGSAAIDANFTWGTANTDDIWTVTNGVIFMDGAAP